MSRTAVPPNPFVGLRPFESADSLYYFGRKEQTHALVKQLDSHRFVAVVGSSGCGKSSLVRAGLIPNLEAGFLVQDRDLWEVATFKPGTAPLYNLAAAIACLGGSGKPGGSAEHLREAVRRRGARVLTDALRNPLGDGESNLLIVVDQFEELFRFQQAKTIQAREEAAEFVSALLYLAKQTPAPVYVVLTMRSDFLGECDAFRGLPEAMNQSQYLVPRLTRDQRREAFLGPVRLVGAEIAPRLMDRLLNESLDTRDDLPILQHVLMRTWAVWVGDGGRGAIDLEHYERSGGLKKALSLHADEALNGLNGDHRLISKRMFQALTETDAANRRIRRPARLSQVAAICGEKAAPGIAMSIIRRFNEDNRNFLVLSSQAPADDPLIDISHESLIRQWDTLAGWVDEEAESARIYQRLAQSADLHADGKAGLYEETDLQVALDWQRQQQPNVEWADRYRPNFNRAIRFLEQSIRKQKTNKQLIISLIACLYTCGYSWLVIATTDDVSLATNASLLPILGTAMPPSLIYLICPLVMISIYVWFLFLLQRLLLILSSQPKIFTAGRSFMARLEQTCMHSLAWITVPLTTLGLWVRYLPRRDWTVTGFHIVLLTLSIFMAVIFNRASRSGPAGPRPLRRELTIPGIAGILLVGLTLWALSFGSFTGTPQYHFKRHGDVHALVPWLFHQVGYDVFFDLRGKQVSKLPENFWLIESQSDRMRAIQGAPLKKANLRYADFYQAFVAKAILRNAKLYGARLREADFRAADLRGANLKQADLRQANFEGADLREANLKDTNLADVDFKDAQLGLADLRRANLNDTDLTGADLRCADLRGVKTAPREDLIDKLTTVSSLYHAKMDPEVRSALQNGRMELFQRPPNVWHDMTTPKNRDTKDICR